MTGYSIVHIGNHEVVPIVDVRAIEWQRDEWKRCAEMLHEALNPPTGPSGECIGDQRRDAEELFARLNSGQPVESELSEANEYARKLSIKVVDLGKDVEALKANLQRKQDAGDLLFEELDDKTPEADCKCFEFCPCYDCDIHGRSRRAIKAWKEANK